MADTFDLKTAQEELDKYTDCLRINKNQLDEELEINAEIYWEIQRNYTRCVARRDNADQDHDIVAARIDRQVRQKYAEDPKNKPTEPAIKNMVLEHPDVQGAFATHAAWAYMTGLWKALMESWSKRSDHLGELGRLHTSGYFVRQVIR